jgi:biotin carboxyl carrier protein
MPRADVEPPHRVAAVGVDWIDLEVDAIQARFTVHEVDGVAYVNGMGWQTSHALPSPFATREPTADAGAPTAPLPSSVVAVLVEPGQRVEPGQALVVLDAMKIEHHVTAQTGGEVLEVRVAPGQRVDAHEVLVVLGP